MTQPAIMSSVLEEKNHYLAQIWAKKSKDKGGPQRLLTKGNTNVFQRQVKKKGKTVAMTAPIVH